MEYFQSTTANIIQFNDYTGTREEFWREDFVEVTLKVSMIKIVFHRSILPFVFYLQAVQKQESTMKEAAGLLGISYNILYQKYRDTYGKIGYKMVKQKCPDSDNEQEDYSIDVSSDDLEDEIVNNSYVTKSSRMTRGRVKAKDLDNHDFNSALGYGSVLFSDEEYDNKSESNATKKPYMCKVPNCSNRYTDPSTCRKHVMRVHGAECYSNYYVTRGRPKKPNYLNKDDSILFGDEESDHNKDTAEQVVAEKPYACQVPGCTKRFTDRSTCRKHVWYHMKASATDMADGDRACQPSKLPPGPSAEQLLADEGDPEVVELQRKYSAQEALWKPETVKKRRSSNSDLNPLPKKWKKSEDPDWLNNQKDPPRTPDSSDGEDDDELNKLSSDLRKFVMEGNSKRFKVRRAGSDFNLAPVKYKGQWIDMKRERSHGKKPCFATILGVTRIHEEAIDSRILKFNGELLAARPLAWSFPQSEEEVNSQYDAVMDAYRNLLGMSEEELHCTFIFLHAQLGGVANSSRNPKVYVKNQLSKKFSSMDKDVLRAELEKRTKKSPADKRAVCKANFGLQYDRCRIQFDQTLKSDKFEGLMLIAWHVDGQPVGKVLNFDNDMRIYVALLRDVWMNLSNKGSYRLPFSEHMISCFKSVFERAFAPSLLQKLIDGTAPSRICPTCGKVFYIMDAIRDGAIFNKHVRKHDTLDCGCEGVDKIDTLLGRVNHKKLYHSNGKYVQCSSSECSDVIPKASVEAHNKHHHLVNIFCELCGETFDNKRKYDYHYTSRHKEVECEVCGKKIMTMNMRSHMASHRGDPVPCPQCGKRYPDDRNLLSHIRNMHTPKEEMTYQCPYHACEKGFRSIKKFCHHLNNMHLKAYVYVCEFGCPGAKYKDQSNIRAHYRKKHEQTLSMVDNFSLEQYLKLLTEEEQIYHHSILSKTAYYEKIKKYNC